MDRFAIHRPKSVRASVSAVEPNGGGPGLEEEGS